MQVPLCRRMRLFARVPRAGRRCGGSARRYGEWAAGEAAAGPATSSGRAGSTVFAEYADEYDVYRPTYPARMWDDVELACARARLRTQPDLRTYSSADVYRPSDSEASSASSLGSELSRGALGRAMDVAAGTGRGALELAQRGRFRDVIATDLDHGMLAQAEASARARSLSIDTLHAPAEDLTGTEDGSIDLCVSLQAFHWFDAEPALREFRRVLNPDSGVLLLAWNDRDTTVPWIQDLETLLEEFNPLYNRQLKQTEHVTKEGTIFWPLFVPADGEQALAGEWGHGSEQEQRKVPCLEYANPTPGMTIDGLVAQLRTMSYVRNALSDTQLAQFEGRLCELVGDHHGDQAFVMPWTTKAYLLQPHWESPFPPHIL